MKEISAERMEQLKARGARVKPAPKPAPPPAPPAAKKRAPRDDGTLKAAADASLNASRLVTSVANALSKTNETTASALKSLSKNIEAGKPVAKRLKINRDRRGFLESIDIIPIPKEEK